MAAFEKRDFEYRGRIGWIRWPLCLGDFDEAMRHIHYQIDTSYEGSHARSSTGGIPALSIEWTWEWKKNERTLSP